MAAWNFIRLSVWRKRYVEQRRSRWVDRLGEEHETLREDVSCESQHGVAIDARMLEVDACCTVCTDDNLELYINTAQSTTAAWCQSPFLWENTYLVIPPVRAGVVGTHKIGRSSCKEFVIEMFNVRRLVACSVVGQTSPSRQTGDRQVASQNFHTGVARHGETPKAVRPCTATDYNDNRCKQNSKHLYQPL